MTSGVDHIAAHTYHGRKGEIKNAFRYSIDYVLMEPEAAPKGPALFSHNRGNLTSVQDTDHGGAPKKGQGPRWVRDVLEAHQLVGVERIWLLTQPRVAGFVFNPVSFWLCYDRNEALIVVIAEVSNTFGDRHSYLCHLPGLAPITRHDRIAARKIFHVSPFQPVEGGYEFRFDVTRDRIGIWIDYAQAEGGLIATLTGHRRPLRNSHILWAAFRRPLGARRVLGLIHWQALKLWWKRALYRPRPLPPDSDVS